MRMKGMIGAMLGAIALGGFNAPSVAQKRPVYKPEPSKPYIPKKKLPLGCQEYCFNRYGGMAFSESEVIYRCIARNIKNARRKFDNWYCQQPRSER